MKNSLKLFAMLSVLTAALWGCGKSDSGVTGANCAAQGCYNQYGGYGGYPGAYNGVSPSAVVLQGFISPAGNNAAWGSFLRGNQLCNTMFNSCSGLDGGAGVTLIVNDASFSGPRGASTGNLTIEAQAGQLPYNVNFLKTANGYSAGLQTAPYIQLNYHNTNGGSTYFLQVVGAVSDSTQTVQLLNNGAVVAQGTLSRIQ